MAKASPLVEQDLQIPEIAPVIPVRDVTVFPYIIVPLSISSESSVSAADAALSTSRMVVLVGQRDVDVDEPGTEELYEVGTVAMVMRTMKLPDNRIRVLVQGISRCRVEYYTLNRPHLEAKISVLGDLPMRANHLETEAMIRNVKSQLERSASFGKTIPSEVLVIANSLEAPSRLADLVASNIEMKPAEAQRVLEEQDVMERLKLVNEYLARELALLEMQQQINSQARGEMDRSQRDYYLRQQLKVIQGELGEGNELAAEIEAYREKIRELDLSEDAEKEAEKQVRRLENMHPDTAETTLIRGYLDWLLELPWGKYTEDNVDLKHAKQVLDKDHHGLTEVKERILEFLAVRKLNPDLKNPVLCFVGPPGVGKTSLGHSIAKALGRKFQRVSLGGVRDEAEIRGHRRTYVGAMPGRVIQGINQAESMNPLVIMDEIDKIGQDFRGDPSAALLEVLDPEQNTQFRDHYLGVPFDLSKVMFILTANTLDTLQPAFRDRLEIIRLSSYTLEEKIEIASRHLSPKQIKEHGMTKKQLSFTKGAFKELIEGYTREAGCRNMERLLAKVCRKVARKIAEEEGDSFKVGKGDLREYLGARKLFPDERLKHHEVGIVAGLAWSPTGGSVMFVECTMMPGKGKLELTGALGDVMKESSRIALSLLRSRSDQYQIDPDLFKERDLHIHFPEGATPKDGPSAGITVATALLSMFTGRAARNDVAMTGELTLRGEVLPIGGLKEKILAASRAGIKHVLIPKLNEPDLEDVPEDIRERLEIQPVSDIGEVFKAALAP